MRINKLQIYWFFLSITSLIIAFILANNVQNQLFANLYILPLCMFGLFFIMRRTIVLCLNILPGFLMISLFFLRNTITPIFVYWGNYVNLFPMIQPVDVNYAILLMCYEFLFFIVCAKIMLPKYLNLCNQQISVVHIDKCMIFFLTILILILFLLYFKYPFIRLNYISIFSLSDVNAVTSSLLEKGSLERKMFFLFSSILNIVRLLFPLCLMVMLKKLMKKNILFLISLLLLVLQLFFIGEELMWILMLEVVLIIAFMKILPEMKKSYLYIIGTAFICLLFILIMAKASSAEEMSSSINSLITTFSIILQSYLPGIANIAGGVFLDRISNDYSYFWADLTYMVPFKSLFFTNRGDILNVLYTYVNNARFQILPFLSQNYYYLYLLFPILNCLVFYISLFYYKKMKLSVGIISYSVYLLICIYFSVAPIFYNISILGLFFTSCFIPLILILKLFKCK